jgi:hypothetical protein
MVNLSGIGSGSDCGHLLSGCEIADALGRWGLDLIPPAAFWCRHQQTPYPALQQRVSPVGPLP